MEHEGRAAGPRPARGRCSFGWMNAAHSLHAPAVPVLALTQVPGRAARCRWLLATCTTLQTATARSERNRKGGHVGLLPHEYSRGPLPARSMGRGVSGGLSLAGGAPVATGASSSARSPAVRCCTGASSVNARPTAASMTRQQPAPPPMAPAGPVCHPRAQPPLVGFSQSSVGPPARGARMSTIRAPTRVGESLHPWAGGPRPAGVVRPACGW